MIFYDPTEARQGTRLPEAVIKAGTPLIGLEAATGADLLLSPLAQPKLDVVDDTVLSKVKFSKHTEVGMLVQRKTGNDVTHLITDHSEIIAKMHPWCKAIAPWLLVVGSYNCNKDGVLIVDGQTTNWSYAAYQAALDAWQYQATSNARFDGGGITILPRDGMVASWISNWLDRLRGMEPTKILAPKKASQVLTLARSDDNMPWRTTLMTFPGVGEELATRVANYCGTLADSLVFISNPDHTRLKQDENYPEGFGPSKFSKAHSWLGLDITDEYTEQLVRLEVARVKK